MNGETHQLCRLVTEVKMALKENRALIYQQEPEKFKKKMEFHFLSRENSGKIETNVVYNPVDWFEKLKEQGIVDIKMMMPTNVGDRQLLGFANTSRGFILTFLKSGEVHYWIGNWKYDSELKMWHITYTEYEWKDAPAVRTSFINNTEAFGDILDRIGVFADKIGYQGFGDIFRDSAAILRGEKEEVLSERQKEFPRPSLPQTHKRIFAAAAKADVFGAMGSWNDSPDWSAHKMGLSEEYNALSGELLTQIRLATLYAVNEW